jgi:hypothetical protein
VPRLRFGRFLNFTTTVVNAGTLPKNLTEHVRTVFELCANRESLTSHVLPAHVPRVARRKNPALPRTAFLTALGSLVAGRREIGDGELGRALRDLQWQYFRPPP